MLYNTLHKRYALFVIVPIWLCSGFIFLPLFVYSHTELTPNYIDVLVNGRVVKKPVTFVFDVVKTQLLVQGLICLTVMPDVTIEKAYFLAVNIGIAYVIPLLVITGMYVCIYVSVRQHAKTQLAVSCRREFSNCNTNHSQVDQHAAEREQRLKLRVTIMMLIVCLVFALTWLPLYSIYTYLCDALVMINSKRTILQLLHCRLEQRRQHASNHHHRHLRAPDCSVDFNLQLFY